MTMHGTKDGLNPDGKRAPGNVVRVFGRGRNRQACVRWDGIEETETVHVWNLKRIEPTVMS